MAETRPILIGCPHYKRFVRGEYEIDAAGEYVLGPDGSFLLGRTRCGHNAGRCTQTLCVLHRHCRRGPTSWFPERIRPYPEGRRRRKPAPDPTPRPDEGLF
jgi:hypothetical protein